MLSLLGSLTEHGWRHTIATIFSQNNTIVRCPKKAHRKYVRVRRKNMSGRQQITSTYEIIDEWEEENENRVRRYKKIPDLSLAEDENVDEWTSTQKKYHRRKHQTSRRTRNDHTSQLVDEVGNETISETGTNVNSHGRSSPGSTTENPRRRLKKPLRATNKRGKSTHLSISTRPMDATHTTSNSEQTRSQKQTKPESVDNGLRTARRKLKARASISNQQRDNWEPSIVSETKSSTKSTIRSVSAESTSTPIVPRISGNTKLKSMKEPGMKINASYGTHPSRSGIELSHVSTRQNNAHFFQQPAMNAEQSSRFVFNQSLPARPQALEQHFPDPEKSQEMRHAESSTSFNIPGRVGGMRLFKSERPVHLKQGRRDSGNFDE